MSGLSGGLEFAEHLPRGGMLERGVQQGLQRGLHEVLDRFVEHDGLEVEYPSGDVIGYGPAPETVRLSLRTTEALAKAMVSPSMVGESFARGEVDITQPDEPRLIPPIKQLVEVVGKNTDRDNQWQHRFRQFRKVADRAGRNPSDPAFHYDRGDPLYGLMLDDTLTYSCAYWGENPANMTLEEAQARKRANILRKICPEPGQRLLDIGSGWGHFAVEAAQQYDLEVVGITLSREQLKASRALAEEQGVADQVRFDFADYRDFANATSPEGRFDQVVSVGMFEHVIKKAEYFAALAKLLKAGGMTLLHTITQEHDKPVNAYINKYIFPGGHLPTLASILELGAHFGFRDPDVESRRRHYELTLDAWGERLEANRDEVIKLADAGEIKHPLIQDGRQLFRNECFYIASSAGCFSEGPLGLAQVVFTNGIRNDGPLTRAHMAD